MNELLLLLNHSHVCEKSFKLESLHIIELIFENEENTVEFS